MTSKLAQTLVPGLKKAQKIRGQWTEIAEETGVSRSTIVKIAAGENTNFTVSTFEAIYGALSRRGHLDSSFVYQSAA